MRALAGTVRADARRARLWRACDRLVMPSTKQMLSSTFDLPEPLAPVMALNCGSKPLITVRRAYDLKPSRMISMRYMGQERGRRLSDSCAREQGGVERVRWAWGKMAQAERHSGQAAARACVAGLWRCGQAREGAPSGARRVHGCRPPARARRQTAMMRQARAGASRCHEIDGGPGAVRRNDGL